MFSQIKSKRKLKLVKRTQQKLQQSTSRQVDQIITFHRLLDTLSKHDQTMNRFQSNSSTLHRCLIKWDKLKSHDRSFTRTSIKLGLELQSFMNQMDYYLRINQDLPHLQQQQQHPVIVVEETTNITTTLDSNDEQPSTQITPSPISLNEAFVEIISAGTSHLRIDEDHHQHQPNYTTTISTTPHSTLPSTTAIIHTNQPDIDQQEEEEEELISLQEFETDNHQYTHTKLGLRKQILFTFKLNQLRYKTKKFNQKFQIHEAKKLKLKFNGNQCILNMVEEGKHLLEFNEFILDLVFHLILLSKSNPII
ncbi:hypothetical protein MJO29_013426 [Puccinia striiformis f. sp. tritici]|nr:hypothetical protein Pst134EA_025881 [Puccinia striiformis f. sp. tritici]KAH9451942.1 hypothetical protein Pst134EA_025881 [Puccinia striiformis f. sp. tritici]KAI7941352.1 hypothetical protein MJO29_013426 [Puccinia striiformis f. sp. tritici]